MGISDPVGRGEDYIGDGTLEIGHKIQKRICDVLLIKKKVIDFLVA